MRLGNRVNLTTVALALILGGAMGNVHDRIAYGSVVDFIEVHIFSYHWPDFNVADSSIVTGACLLFLDSLRAAKEKQAEILTANALLFCRYGRNARDAGFAPGIIGRTTKALPGV